MERGRTLASEAAGRTAERDYISYEDLPFEVAERVGVKPGQKVRKESLQIGARETQPEKEEAKRQGILKREKQNEFNRVKHAVKELQDTKELIGKIKSHPGLEGATGLVRYGQIGGTEAAGADSLLTQLEAKSAFGSLKEMREQSKTGGALGQVSNIELELLKTAKVATQRKQKTKQIKENLDDFDQKLEMAISDVKNRWRGTYGTEYDKEFLETPDEFNDVDFTPE